jgi:universal stress protein E
MEAAERCYGTVGMKKILCATDFSLRSELAIDRAAALSREFDADLTLLHVVDDDQPRPMVDRRSDEALTALTARATVIRSRSGITATVEIRRGTVSATIVEAARSLKIDLLVMGVHRRRLVSEVIIGTTLERVLRTGHGPVLMVNAVTLASYESVLLALDASDASARAVRTAKSLGLLEDEHISVVHAFEPIHKGMMGWAGVREETVKEYSVGWEREARDQLLRFLESIGLSDTVSNIVLEEGPPFVAIKKVVERLRPHLLVIGTRGHTGLKRVLLGSVAERVLLELECDVLAVPPMGESTD